jgi:hypothetical protein
MLIWSTPDLLSSIALMGIYSAEAYSLPNEQQRKALKELKMINDVGKTIIQHMKPGSIKKSFPHPGLAGIYAAV